MTKITNLFVMLAVILFIGCSDDDDQQFVQVVQDTTLIETLKELGFTTENGGIVKNNKVLNTRYLNLSGKKLKALEGLGVFENLEVLNLENNAIESINLSKFPKLKDLSLAKNPKLTKIEGLEDHQTSILEKLVLPFHLRHEFGALPLFVKERSKLNPQFSAKIEKNVYGDELRDYNYYYIFKNVNVSNYIFRFLGEDNFLIVDYKGKKIEGLDMSIKLKADPSKEYNLLINADRVTSYEDVEILINNGLKYSNFPLKSFELTTGVATSIESLDRLDFSDYQELESVKIDKMPIKEVYFNGCKNLKKVEIGNSSLVDLAVPKKPALTSVSLNDSPLLESLNLNAMPTLNSISVHKDAPVKELYLSNVGASEVANLNASNLETVKLIEVAISKIDLKSEVLKSVKVVETEVAELDFSKAKKLSGDIIIGENRNLKTITFPTAKNQESSKIQIYRNQIKSLDLTMYKRIDVLATVVWTGKVYKEKDGVKGAEEGLEELLLDVDAIKNNLPESPGKDWDGSNKASMKVYLDADFLKKSKTAKKLYTEAGTDKTKPYTKLYKYGYKYGEYRNVGSVKSMSDFE